MCFWYWVLKKEEKNNLVLAEVFIENIVESPREYNFYQTCKIKILLLVGIKTHLHIFVLTTSFLHKVETMFTQSFFLYILQIEQNTKTNSYEGFLTWEGTKQFTQNLLIRYTTVPFPLWKWKKQSKILS